MCINQKKCGRNDNGRVGIPETERWYKAYIIKST